LHALRHEVTRQKHLLVMGKSMNFIDLAGAELWEAELAARRGFLKSVGRCRGRRTVTRY
jgi:hypothetical protein